MTVAPLPWLFGKNIDTRIAARRVPGDSMINTYSIMMDFSYLEMSGAKR